MRWSAYPLIRYPLVGGLITVLTFALQVLLDLPAWMTIPPYMVAIVLGGFHWAREAFEILIEERRVGIGFLMLSALIGSAALGLWEEAAFLSVLYGAAEGVEEYTYSRTRESIRGLLDLVPKEATVLDEEQERRIPAENISVGDTLLIRPGEALASDGIVLRGMTTIDQSAVTGESIPVVKDVGQEVFAGTINQEGSILVKVTKGFEDNTIARIIHLVEEAQEEKGRTHQFIDRFGSVYSPIVFIVGILLILIPVALGLDISDWVERAVIFLVAAAPCALVMSTPVAIAAGIGRSGRSGVLIKGGIHLENLGMVRAVAFDKTGTITTGDPVVTDIIPLSMNEAKVLQMAASAERLSEHPFARPILDRAEKEGLKLLEVSEFQALIGYGVRATVGNEEVFVGQPSIFEERGVSMPDQAILDRLQNEGKTPVLVGSDGQIYGVLALRDEPRTGAKMTIDDLQRMDIDVIMLTGDNPTAASNIAAQIGILDARADLSPEEKIEEVRNLKEQFGVVAMIGDGINDAPALAEATVGIAMGAAGTDAAIQAADVALMSDEISKVPYAISMGRRARRIGMQNIVFSLMVLAILIPSALLGVLGVAAVILFHEASEMIAVANGVRAGREP
jgi:heavy metal translocating P-type ATPase